ncbi:MAG TPA: DUF2569 family protein [Syntrophorhabdaceae bacterium]|nr:DUF2569 family protein [Syntrophorhabdaceae bacterium]HPU29432.1 DUF2569 family protein [Syntrophorhabdaceae bacterium]
MKNSNQYIGIKGWLLLLCLSLTIFDPISMFIYTLLVSSLTKPYFSTYKNLFYLILINGIFNIALITYSIYAGICLWKQYKGAVSIAKKYFIFLFFYSLIGAFLPYFFGVYKTPFKKNIFNTILNMGYAIIWYVYLSVSKRVKNTYEVSQ